MHTRTLNYEICVKRRKILVFVVLSCTNKSVYAAQKWCLCKERLNNGEKKNWKRNRIEPKAKQWTLTWIRMGQWMAPSETGWMNEWMNERTNERANETLLKCRRCWYCRINGNGVHWFYVYLPNVPIGIWDSRACCWNVISFNISTHSLLTTASPLHTHVFISLSLDRNFSWYFSCMHYIWCTICVYSSI